MGMQRSVNHPVPRTVYDREREHESEWFPDPVSAPSRSDEHRALAAVAPNPMTSDDGSARGRDQKMDKRTDIR